MKKMRNQLMMGRYCTMLGSSLSVWLMLSLLEAVKGFSIAADSSVINTRAETLLMASTGASSDTETEWDVDLYQNRHSFVWEYGSSVVADLLNPQPGETILDIGCGSGELTNQISESGPNIATIGIDADPNMIQRATEKFSNSKFYQADVTNLELLDLDDELPSQVDAIFSNAALHWVKDEPEKAVSSMSKALKSGGRFVVEFGGKGNVHEIVSATLKVQGLDPDDSGNNPWYFPSIGEYSSILEQNKIEVLSATLYDRPTLLEDGKNGMKNWLLMFGDGLFSSKEYKPDTEKEALINEAVEMLHSSSTTLYNKDENQWYADYRRIRIVGKKV